MKNITIYKTFKNEDKGTTFCRELNEALTYFLNEEDQRLYPEGVVSLDFVEEGERVIRNINNDDGSVSVDIIRDETELPDGMTWEELVDLCEDDDELTHDRWDDHWKVYVNRDLNNRKGRQGDRLVDRLVDLSVKWKGTDITIEEQKGSHGLPFKKTTINDGISVDLELKRTPKTKVVEVKKTYYVEEWVPVNDNIDEGTLKTELKSFSQMMNDLNG